MSFTPPATGGATSYQVAITPTITGIAPITIPSSGASGFQFNNLLLNTSYKFIITSLGTGPNGTTTTGNSMTTPTFITACASGQYLSSDGVCSVDCVGIWNSTNCSSQCGTGTQQNTFSITTNAIGHGKACPNPTVTTSSCTAPDCPTGQVCNVGTCQNPCTGTWADTDTCSTTTCGTSGTKIQNYTAGTGTTDYLCPNKTGDQRIGSTACTNVPCDISSAITATAITNTSITISYGSASGATSYDIYMNNSSSPVNEITTSHQFTGLTPNVSYSFYVVPRNSAGSGTPSKTVTFITSCPSGTTNSSGICCPTGQVNTNGICCAQGKINANGICCDQGQYNNNGVCSVDCVGTWSNPTCPNNQCGTTTITNTFTTTTSSLGNGRACPNPTVTTSSCTAPACPTGQVCNNGTCQNQCTGTWADTNTCSTTACGSSGTKIQNYTAGTTDYLCPNKTGDQRIGSTACINAPCGISSGIVANGISTNSIKISYGSAPLADSYNITITGPNNLKQTTNTTFTTGIFANLAQNTSYSFYVVPINSVGSGPQSSPVSITTSCPTGTTNTNGICCASGQINADGICCASGQHNYNNSCANQCNGSWSDTSTCSTTACGTSGVYVQQYNASAADSSCGNSTQNGTTTCINAPCGISSGIVANGISTNSIKISYGSAPLADSYNITITGPNNLKQTTNTTFTTGIFANLAQNTSYSFYVVPINSVGSGPQSSPVSITTSCPTGTTNTNGICCASGQINADGICCASGQHNYNNSCANQCNGSWSDTSTCSTTACGTSGVYVQQYNASAADSSCGNSTQNGTTTCTNVPCQIQTVNFTSDPSHLYFSFTSATGATSYSVSITNTTIQNNTQYTPNINWNVGASPNTSYTITVTPINTAGSGTSTTASLTTPCPGGQYATSTSGQCASDATGSWSGWSSCSYSYCQGNLQAGTQTATFTCTPGNGNGLSCQTVANNTSPGGTITQNTPTTFTATQNCTGSSCTYCGGNGAVTPWVLPGQPCNCAVGYGGTGCGSYWVKAYNTLGNGSWNFYGPSYPNTAQGLAQAQDDCASDGGCSAVVIGWGSAQNNYMKAQYPSNGWHYVAGATSWLKPNTTTSTDYMGTTNLYVAMGKTGIYSGAGSGGGRPGDQGAVNSCGFNNSSCFAVQSCGGNITYYNRSQPVLLSGGSGCTTYLAN